jgi:hypothetical protein
MVYHQKITDTLFISLNTVRRCLYERLIEVLFVFNGKQDSLISLKKRDILKEKPKANFHTFTLQKLERNFFQLSIKHG